MLSGAGTSFDRGAVLAGTLTPVFFGSGDQQLRRAIAARFVSGLLHRPRSRRAAGRIIEPDHPAFSGFVFKIQANMDPRHRDRIAFVRVCSGKFTRDMSVTHAQGERKVRLSSSHKLFGRERETVDEAFPGMLSDSSAIRASASVTRSPKIHPLSMTRFRVSLPSALPTCMAPSPRSSNGSGRVWINCCKRAWCRCWR